MSQNHHPDHSVNTASTIAPPLAVAELSERCMGNHAIATLALDKFEKQLAADLGQIENRCAAHDAAQIARAAHALKGAAGAMAATTLQLAAARIEGLARQSLLDSVAQEVAGLRSEVERCLRYLPTARRVLTDGAPNVPAVSETDP